MKISPARKSAFEILKRIETDKSFTSALLPVYEEPLARNDAALCHEITLGVLRKRMLLDRIINVFGKKKNLAKYDIEVLVALRIGLYQVFFLDKIPDYSAINESVNLVKAAKKHSAAGLVNAVLRRASKELPKLNYSDPIEKLSIETSHPQWLIRKWVAQFGYDETRKLTDANNLPAMLTFRFTMRFYESAEETRDEVLNILGRKDSLSVASEFVNGCYTTAGISETLAKIADSGLIYFQDPASQAVANLVDLENGDRFLDLCASPGSKTTLIAASNRTRNAELICGDFRAQRLRVLKRNLAKQGVRSVRVLQYDAENELPFEDEDFDVVLVDAPCSGTGTIRHNPEIRYSINDGDFNAISHKQLKILENASKLIKCGGKLIYSTCSLEVEENEEVIEQFAARHKDFSVLTARVPAEFLTERGFARTFPQRDEMDGFFVAEMLRQA